MSNHELCDTIKRYFITFPNSNFTQLVAEELQSWCVLNRDVDSAVDAIWHINLR